MLLAFVASLSSESNLDACGSGSHSWFLRKRSLSEEQRLSGLAVRTQVRRLLGKRTQQRRVHVADALAATLAAPSGSQIIRPDTAPSDQQRERKEGRRHLAGRAATERVVCSANGWIGGGDSGSCSVEG